MMTDGWNWEDAVLKKDDGLWLNWPGYYAADFDLETFTRVVKKNDKGKDEVQYEETISLASVAGAKENPPPEPNPRRNIDRGTCGSCSNSSRSFSLNLCRRRLRCSRVILLSKRSANAVNQYIAATHVCTPAGEDHPAAPASDTHAVRL